MTDRCQIQGKLESQYHQVVKFCCEFLIQYGRLTLIFKLDKKNCIVSAQARPSDDFTGYVLSYILWLFIYP